MNNCAIFECHALTLPQNFEVNLRIASQLYGPLRQKPSFALLRDDNKLIATPLLAMSGFQIYGGDSYQIISE